MYTSKLQNPEADQLMEAILTLENMEEAYRFFEDICTVSELRSIAQRFDVAKMLREGMTYTAIAEKTGASTATISRVNRALQFGCEGYKLVFEKDGNIYGSTTGAVEDGEHIAAFDEVFIANTAEQQPEATKVEEPTVGNNTEATTGEELPADGDDENPAEGTEI